MARLLDEARLWCVPRMEPGGAPPVAEGPVGVGGIYDGGKDSADSGEELGSDSFWNSLSELSIAGMTVTPDQAKKIIYSIGAILLVLGLLLVAHLLPGGDTSMAPPTPTRSTTGNGTAPLRNAPITFTARLTADADEFRGAQFIVYGSECSLPPASPSACGGVLEARCGMTEDGELYAWLGTTCDGDPPCSVRRGPARGHGCSRTSDEDGTFVECCVALPEAVKTPGNCPAATPSCR
eukprot:COSAG02_NODE_1319_length_13272_cov_10.015714_6_plen_237_part_00